LFQNLSIFKKFKHILWTLENFVHYYELPVVTDKTGFWRDFGNLGREKKPAPEAHHVI
jgi:hypothetical protein